ncbi:MULTISPECIES: glycosyltransferase [unclassified Sphingomonas]|uniref:glycosyltransferase n=1 Tax=unclassified Sphingomonas TaxID=196159 RepID=UPI00286B870A|nr:MULTISPECIES: glycosyltransferase [unclassified Sphingomonas]
MLNLAAFRLRTVARNYARNRDWSAAATAYQAYLSHRPKDMRSWVQYGHAAKEAGDLTTAAEAYDRALQLAPHVAENWFHLSHVRKRQGDRDGAIVCCLNSLSRDPTFADAIDQLIALGARDHIPAHVDSTRHQPAAIDSPDPERPLDQAIYGMSRYDEFRRELVIGAPPRGIALSETLTIIIEARLALPAEVRASLSTLLDQTDGRWSAIILASSAICSHSVASLAALDERVCFIDIDAQPYQVGDARHVLLIAAGTLLDRQAVAWFSFAAARTQCIAAYCDHDHSIDDWRTGRTFMEPMFQPMFDPDWFRNPRNAPLAIMIDSTRVAINEGLSSHAGQILSAAASDGSVVHLPLLLATCRRLPAAADQALPDAPLPSIPAAIAPEAQSRPSSNANHIRVVIQTRDEAEMLRVAVESLQSKALRPDLLDIIVIDNRSRESATARLLNMWQRRGTATVMTLDEPFNWSRANNLAVETGEASLLLFLNNDTQMLTQGWDAMLCNALSQDDVGAVGATLLYPDHTLQHAGIIMGMGRGGPIHEGVGRAVASGPNDRWRVQRSAAAVTGAFLAMRTDLFIEIKGFDALRFAIAFNDIDLCLRVRETGRRIVMMSDLHVIHHESKTRGINATRSQVAWDLDELARLYERWGPALFQDPAYNPHWTQVGQPFDGCRFPSYREIIRHIDRSARSAPWAPIDERHEATWW